MDKYYDSHLHEFSSDRLTKLTSEILSLRRDPHSLLDVGCGTGNTMVALAEQLGVEAPVGVESSENMQKIATERTGHKVIRASVIDEGFADAIGGQFDVVVLAAVLHHLVGRTRRASRHNIETAFRNARSVVAPGGLLVIHEPVFRPAVSLSLLFYAKSIVATIARGRRVPVGSYWANIGAPRVSYLTPGQLRDLVEPCEYFDLTRTSMPRIARIGGLFARYDASVIVKAER